MIGNTSEDILILAIESSCDETAASVVKNGRTVLSNVISSQIATHTVYGGVVPEIASREHIKAVNYVIERALAEAQTSLEEITAIGVTYGPGLVGALLVGVAEAKALAYAAKKPLIGVHHIEGHVSANFIENPDLKPPFVCLIVSGGHTHLVIVKDYGEFEIIGRTRMTLQARHLIRWPGPWGWDIRAVQRLTRLPGKAMPMPWNFPGARWTARPMISASAALNQQC